MTKVFVSSVIDGFEKERAIAKAAIKSLRMEPIMAEDIGAKPYTPRAACLDGIRESNVFLAIMGDRYGYTADTNISVCEEEFVEAQKRGIPILIIVIKNQPEPRQAAFIERVSNYTSGYFIDFCDHYSQIGPKITKALYDHIIKAAPIIKPQEAVNVISTLIESLRPKYNTETHLGMIIMPTNISDDYISILELETDKIKNKLLQMAMFGSPAIFDYKFGTHFQHEIDYLELIQLSGRDEHIGVLHCYPNGCLCWIKKLENDDIDLYSLIHNFLIDEDKIRTQLNAFVVFAASYYESFINNRPLPGLFTNVVLWGMEHKQIGRIPKVATHSISMGFGCDENPLIFPERPLQISLAELKNSVHLAEKLMQFVMRLAKAKNLYYEPKENLY